MRIITNAKNLLCHFHNDERGLEALQVVMIIAIAAIFLIAVKTQWETVESWYNDLVEQVTGWQPN